MDHETFDRLTKLVGAAVSRRAALASLAGLGLVGTSRMADAKKKSRKKRKARNRKQSRRQADVTAQAANCLNLGQGVNVSGCNYAGEDHSGENLSSSRMVRTNFRNGTLIGTNFSSSNLKRARFRGANLQCADLSSSTLRQTDLRGADLTRADLSSSGCGGLRVNANTTFCGTIDCNGNVRDDDCPDGPPEGVCCNDAECLPGRECVGGTCQYSPGTCDAGQDTCKQAGSLTCNGSVSCFCSTTKETQATFCRSPIGLGLCHDCATDADCAEFGAAMVCIDLDFERCVDACPTKTACVPPCRV